MCSPTLPLSHSPALACCCIVACIPLLAGCFNTVPADKYNQVTAELLTCQERTRKMEAEINDLQLSVRALESQATARLPDFRGGSLQDLVLPVKIELERRSGGYDRDDKPGDEGLILYVQPVDRDGSIIKVAGTIKVTLFDLQNPPERNRLGECSFDAQTTRSLWMGRFLTNHFTVRCPFPQPPAHDRITAEVVFTDLLSGRELRAQQVYTIKLGAQATARR